MNNRVLQFASNSRILKHRLVPDEKETELLKFTSETKSPGLLGRKIYVFLVIEIILFYCLILKCYEKKNKQNFKMKKALPSKN